MEQNKTRKYLKYAIGEIVLVVIGILIALQINNWNEGRKETQQERQIIESLRLEFKNNRDSLKLDIASIESAQNSRLIILKVLNKTHEYINLEQSWDSLLATSIFVPSYFPSSYILEDLKSSGKIFQLKNKSLRVLLYKYDQQYSRIIEAISLSRSPYEYLLEYLKVHAVLRNIDATSPKFVMFGNSILKENNIHLLDDLQFENAIDDVYALMDARRLQYKRALDIIDQILEATNGTDEK